MAYLFTWFQKKGVTMISGVKQYVKITDKGLDIINKEGVRQTIEADSIVPAMPLSPNTELLEGLKGKVSEIYAVGDCKEPLLIADAISTGMEVARSL